MIGMRRRMGKEALKGIKTLDQVSCRERRSIRIQIPGGDCTTGRK